MKTKKYFCKPQPPLMKAAFFPVLALTFLSTFSLSFAAEMTAPGQDNRPVIAPDGKLPDSTPKTAAFPGLSLDPANENPLSAPAKMQTLNFLQLPLKEQLYLLGLLAGTPEYQISKIQTPGQGFYSITLSSKKTAAQGRLSSVSFTLKDDPSNWTSQVQTDSISFSFAGISGSPDVSGLYTGVDTLAKAVNGKLFVDINPLLTLTKITVKSVKETSYGQLVDFDYLGVSYTRFTLNYKDAGFGLVERTGWIHYPNGKTNGINVPLVLNFHGAGGDGAGQMIASGMNASSDKEGYIAVYPDGIDKGWNTPVLAESPKFSNKMDDLGFIDTFLDAFMPANHIDASKLYATGLSNGGMMTYNLAVNSRHKFAAIAVVSSGIIRDSDYAPSSPVPILVIHGTSDFIIPYKSFGLSDLLSGNYFYGVDSQLIPHLLQVNGIQGAASSPYSPYPGYKSAPEIQALTWGTGKSQIVRIEIFGGGHVWPGGTFPSILGWTTPNLDANKTIWDFFNSHPL